VQVRAQHVVIVNRSTPTPDYILDMARERGIALTGALVADTRILIEHAAKYGDVPPSLAKAVLRVLRRYGDANVSMVTTWYAECIPAIELLKELVSAVARCRGIDILFVPRYGVPRQVVVVGKTEARVFRVPADADAAAEFAARQADVPEPFLGNLGLCDVIAEGLLMLFDAVAEIMARRIAFGEPDP